MTKHPLFQTLADINRLRNAQRPLFELGQLLSTPGALRVLDALDLTTFWIVEQHRHGAWGDLGAEDKASNDQALLNGGRIFSAYDVKNAAKGSTTRLYVITEAVNEATGRRDCTTLLRADEY
jgi:hypothetical protein